MKTAVVYPYVVPKADEYRPAFRRFVDTYKEFPAGADHELWLTLCNGDQLADEDYTYAAITRSIYFWCWTRYHDDGWDIGCHQHTANCMGPEYDFAVFCSSQVHFHRAGWLERMLEARDNFGPGLYGAMASLENRPHIRTCFFGCDPAVLRAYPHVINSREKSLEFESGYGPLGFTSWMQSAGKETVLVSWDGFYRQPNWRDAPNIFRRGDQWNCLVWDRHTEIYANASAEEKVRLEASADGKP